MNSSGNQANSATRGGMGATPTPANSGGSGIFGSTAVGATHGNEDSGAGSISGQSGRRVSFRPSQHIARTRTDLVPIQPSQEQSPMFGGLSSLKRDSGNTGQTQRRTSLGEQGFQAGVLGTMWKKYVFTINTGISASANYSTQLYQRR